MGKGSKAARTEKASNVANIGAAVAVTIRGTDNKPIQTMVPEVLSNKNWQIFEHALEVYFMEGGIKEHTEALEKLQAAPDSLGNQLLEFGKDCARLSGGDAGRTLDLFEGSCALSESRAKREAIKRGTDKKKATIRDILPNWLQNKTTVKQLLTRWAEPRSDAAEFNILGTATNNSTKKTADIFHNITAVRKVLAEKRAPGRNQVTLAGVTDASPNLEVSFKYLAKVSQGYKGNLGMQNLLAKELSSMVTEFVKAHPIIVNEKDTRPASEVVATEVSATDAKEQAKRGGSHSGAVAA